VQVVLASRSPQRREILARLGIRFEAVQADVEELSGGDPAAEIPGNALRKARAVAAPGRLVIGCDTDVVVDGRALGKPGNEGEAREFLGMLSGRTHEVLSGLALVGPGEGQERTGSRSSRVTFHEIDDAELERYLAWGEWRERAGGYAIQGLGSTLVAAVEGDIANVIGLPVGLLLELAPELGP
jgi:septum formation protein